MQALPEDGLLPGRLWLALGLAALLHGGLLVMAYLAPPPAPPPREQVIQMEVVPPRPPPPAPKPELPPPAERQPEQTQPPPRRLPSLLEPVKRAESKPAPQSPAIVVPEQSPPKAPAEPEGTRKGPIDLFSKDGLNSSLGVPRPGAPVPHGPDRLLGDDRLKEKKEPDFVLVPEKGGGFKCESKTFTAHIGPDGALSFKDSGPIGFAKGMSGFSVDFTDLIMRGKKQDPYAAEKRRFMEFTKDLRDGLMRKKILGEKDSRVAGLGHDLEEIWESSKPAAVRRRELFEYWVENGDDEPGSGVQRARRMVEEYVREHLPEDSPDAYTAEELRRFAQQRTGLTKFMPYGPR